MWLLRSSDGTGSWFGCSPGRMLRQRATAISLHSQVSKRSCRSQRSFRQTRDVEQGHHLPGRWSVQIAHHTSTLGGRRNVRAGSLTQLAEPGVGFPALDTQPVCTGLANSLPAEPHTHKEATFTLLRQAPQPASPRSTVNTQSNDLTQPLPTNMVRSPRLRCLPRADQH